MVYVGVIREERGTLSGMFRLDADSGNWTHVTDGLPGTSEVQAITVHPNDPALLYAGTQDGPYRSTDRGESWRRLAFPERGVQIWSFAIHPTDPRIVFAGAAPAAVFRSDDAGDSWRRLPHSSLPPKLRVPFACRVMRLAINPGNPDEICAIQEINGAMRSRDGGETWEDCSRGLIALAEQAHLRSRIVCDDETEGMLDGHALCVSPAAPGTVFAAMRLGLFRSDDGGEAWQEVGIRRFSPMTYAHDIRVSPQDPRAMYACLSAHSRGDTGSVFRSGDLGRSWRRFDHSIQPKSTIMAVALHHSDPDQVYCVARNGQAFGTRDGGTTWREYPLPAGCRGVYAVACA